MLFGSPAINAGSNPNNLTTDQRGTGFDRVENGQADIGAFEVQINKIEGNDNNNTLPGTAGDDYILGKGGNDLIEGRAGNDTLDGGLGFNDRLFGHGDNDTLTDPDGVNTAIGDTGNDTITVTFAAAWDNDSQPSTAPRSNGKITGGYGDDIITVTMNNSQFFINLKGDEPDSNTPQDGSDVVTLLGSYANSVVDLGGGNDTFNGGVGSDNVSGGNGNDTILGGSGNDLIEGRAGNDTLDGGLGFNDRLFGHGDNDTLTDPDGVNTAIGDTGNDTITVTFAAAWDNDSQPSTAPRSNGKITGGYGDDIITVTMNNSQFFINLKGDEPDSDTPQDGSDVVTLLGSYGNSVVDLGGGNDTFNGGGGSDNVSGGNGNDTLLGSNGNDLIEGGTGADSLTGGSGVDTFRYPSLSDSLLSGFDQITDLVIGTDKIDGPKTVSAANLAELGAVAALTEADIGVVLTSSSFMANRAATFTFNTRTFLALNNNIAGFSETTDAIVEITGYSGNLSNLAII